MKRLQTQAAIHHTIIFSVLGLMSDTEALLALVSLGVPLPADGSERSQPEGRWLACGLRSDGVVELWRTAACGILPRLLKAAGIPFRLRDCAG